MAIVDMGKVVMTKVVMDKQVLMVEVVMLVVTAKVAMIRVGMVMQDTVEGTHMVVITGTSLERITVDHMGVDL